MYACSGWKRPIAKSPRVKVVRATNRDRKYFKPQLFLLFFSPFSLSSLLHKCTSISEQREASVDHEAENYGLTLLCISGLMTNAINLSALVECLTL